MDSQDQCFPKYRFNLKSLTMYNIAKYLANIPNKFTRETLLSWLNVSSIRCKMVNPHVDKMGNYAYKILEEEN